MYSRANKRFKRLSIVDSFAMVRWSISILHYLHELELVLIEIRCGKKSDMSKSVKQTRTLCSRSKSRSDRLLEQLSPLFNEMFEYLESIIGRNAIVWT